MFELEIRIIDARFSLRDIVIYYWSNSEDNLLAKYSIVKTKYYYNNIHL